MDRRKKNILIVGALLATLAIFMPPWAGARGMPLPYRLGQTIFNPPRAIGGRGVYGIDTPRLGAILLGIGILTGGVLYVLGRE